MKAGEAIAKKFCFVSKIKLFWGKSGLPRGQACWVIPSAGNREDSACLLYTSDAADEEDSVDLGGRRIIKKNSTWGCSSAG